MLKKKPKIIRELSKYWISKGVWFGDLIHDLKPSSIQEWHNFLSSKNWFFIRDMKYKPYERRQWIFYLKHSFWKLFQSESIAIDYFKTKYHVDLKFTPHALDVKYDYDFFFEYDHETFYVIVKTKINDKRKSLILLPNVLLFESDTKTLFGCNPLD